MNILSQTPAALRPMPVSEFRATMRVAQVTRPGGPLELVERPIPDPGPGSVRIKVQACGICHSDAMTKEGLWPGITFPRVPGHEVVGVIDAVAAFNPNERIKGKTIIRVRPSVQKKTNRNARAPFSTATVRQRGSAPRDHVAR